MIYKDGFLKLNNWSANGESGGRGSASRTFADKVRNLEGLLLPLTEHSTFTFDIAGRELEWYFNTERRALIQGVENLWHKYAVSSRQHVATLSELNGFLKGMGYLQ